MKNLLVQITTLTFLVIALARTEGSAQSPLEGQIMVGGSIGLQHTSSDDAPSETIIELAPGIGIVTTARAAIGVDLLYQRESNINSTFSAYGISPFFRYYVYKGLFPQFQYLWVNAKFEDSNISGRASETGYEFSLGYTSFLSPSVALEPTVYYWSIDKNNSIGLRVGFRVFL